MIVFGAKRFREVDKNEEKVDKNEEKVDKNEEKGA
jgi:hypothetical protein